MVIILKEMLKSDKHIVAEMMQQHKNRNKKKKGVIKYTFKYVLCSRKK